MTAPLHHPLVADGRGHRSPQTLQQISERDTLLREAARFYPGASDREVARRLRVALSRYQTGRWRRSRADLSCPHEAGRLDALCWHVLKAARSCAESND